MGTSECSLECCHCSYKTTSGLELSVYQVPDFYSFRNDGSFSLLVAQQYSLKKPTSMCFHDHDNLFSSLVP